MNIPVIPTLSIAEVVLPQPLVGGSWHSLHTRSSVP